MQLIIVCIVFLLQVLQMHFLTVCWNLIAYGSAFFTGYVRKVVSHFTVMKVVIITRFKRLCMLMLDLIIVLSGPKNCTLYKFVAPIYVDTEKRSICQTA